MVFHLSLSDSRSPGLFLVFWPFSIMLSFGWSPLVRQLPSPQVPLVNPLVTVPNASITIGIIVTCMLMMMILLHHQTLLLVSYNPPGGLYRILRVYAFDSSMFFAASFRWYLSVILIILYQRDEKFRKVQFSVFPISWDYLVNMFIYLFFDYTQGSHYYWHSDSFKVPHFFSYFQLFCIYFFYYILWLIC